MTRYTTLALLIPALAAAQSLPATHVHSGLDATSARYRIERDGKRPYGPKFEAAGMPAPSAIELFPGLRLPGQKEDFRRQVSPIRVVKPAYRIPEKDFGIADVQDVLFLGEKRLVRFRIHLKASGEPLSRRWTAQLRKYFDYLDRDGNGQLNRYEAEFAFTNAGVVQMLRTGFAYQRADDAPRTFVDLDAHSDLRISFDEFAAYYSPSAARIISAQANPVRDIYADALTDNLFALFDTDKDGKLSKTELTAVEKLLTSMDLDEDECLSAMEVSPDVFNGRTTFRNPATAAPNSQQPMLAFVPGNVPESILQTILTRYDVDKNLKLSRAENPFDDATFKTLDRNGDGELVVTDLAGWKELAPDLALEMTLGEKPEQGGIKTLPPSAMGLLASGFKPAAAGSAVFTIGTQNVQLACYSPTGVYSQLPRANAFQFADGGKGFITEKELAGPQFQALRVLFDTIDRNADGKMTRAEYDAFFDFQKDFTRLPLSLVYSAQTPSLFQVLDTNGDGRLSVRELRDAWTRLSALEPGAKEHVTRGALVPQGAIRFGRTNEVFSANQVSSYTQPAVRQSSRGPTWFRKFDRNGDAELSRNEFPGSAEDFDRMDGNRDGLVTLEEAEAADKVLRAKK